MLQFHLPRNDQQSRHTSVYTYQYINNDMNNVDLKQHVYKKVTVGNQRWTNLDAFNFV